MTGYTLWGRQPESAMVEVECPGCGNAHATPEDAPDDFCSYSCEMDWVERQDAAERAGRTPYLPAADDEVDPCLIDVACPVCGCVSRLPVGETDPLCSPRCAEEYAGVSDAVADLSPTLPAGEAPF